MGDWILLLGGLLLVILGLVAWFRPNLLWQLYSLEPRWRREHPSPPSNWAEKARRQTYYYLAFGAIFILLSEALRGG